MRNKKQLAARILKTSPKKVRFAADALDDVKKAITRSDIRGLIAVGKVSKTGSNHHSRAGARKIASQKKKGRQKGKGSKKGSKHSVVSRKEMWMTKIRVQRKFIKELRERELITPKDYRSLYSKTKGGFFRNKRHIKLYLSENHMVKKE
jgi:large subunit ribosomal protein L19e